MAHHAYHTAPKSVEWFIIIDDDTYVFADNLMDFLSRIDSSRPWYFGSRIMAGDILFAHGGSGVVMSRKALEISIGQHPEYVHEYEKKCFDICCGDAVLGLMFKEKGNISIAVEQDIPGLNHAFQGQSTFNIGMGEDRWCQKLITMHHVSPHEVEVLWEYEQLHGRVYRADLTYAKYYHDFVQPYIEYRIMNWDNKITGTEYTKHNWNKDGAIDGSMAPWRNVSTCLAACERDEGCLAWRYLPGEQYCAVSNVVDVGQPAHPLMGKREQNNTAAESGWMLGRIRQMRKKQHCDVLYHNESAEGIARDGSENDWVEGWWLRKGGAAKRLHGLWTAI